MDPIRAFWPHKDPITAPPPTAGSARGQNGARPEVHNGFGVRGRKCIGGFGGARPEVHSGFEMGGRKCVGDFEMRDRKCIVGFEMRGGSA